LIIFVLSCEIARDVWLRYVAYNISALCSTLIRKKMYFTAQPTCLSYCSPDILNKLTK